MLPIKRHYRLGLGFFVVFVGFLELFYVRLDLLCHPLMMGQLMEQGEQDYPDDYGKRDDSEAKVIEGYFFIKENE